MFRARQGLIVLLALVGLLTVGAGLSHAQNVVVTYTPVVSYYPPPVVSYYRPPVVAYYPAPDVVVPATAVTTYQYGVLPRRRVYVSTYTPVLVTPTVRYYNPVYVYP
jgi:hypothetical protein